MTTRLEDAVISVRIETGRARSQLHSLKSDIGDMSERQRMVRQRVVEAGGAHMPGLPGEGGGAPSERTPGKSQTRESYRESGIKDGSPGELRDPFRHLEMVQSLRDIVHSKSPAQILAQTGNVLSAIDDQFKGKYSFIGKLGGAARLLGMVPGVVVNAMEATQAVDYFAQMTKTALNKDNRDIRDQQGEWFGKKGVFQPGEVEFEERMQAYDTVISKFVSFDEAFAQTKTMAGATALVGGKAMSPKAFARHFDRFSEFSEFTYRFNKRTRRSLTMEAGLNVVADTIPGLMDGGSMFMEALMPRVASCVSPSPQRPSQSTSTSFLSGPPQPTSRPRQTSFTESSRRSGRM